MNKIYEYNLIVQTNEIDINKHVNNVVYIQWMQDAAVKHSENLGFGTKKYLELGSAWVVKEHKISYLRSAVLDDEIIIYTHISKMQGSEFTREYKIVKKSNNKVIAKASTIWVYFDTVKNRVKKEVEKEILEAFL
ncbi:MAG: acyl-CoA thioesterase [Campylobacterales bacterium]|nr:acyl-CoA thioesterase [Campylobacterales bacterium]NQY54396.1 acyl-CoA thioesterase [Campylobacteraceae bacterium]